MRGQSAPTGRPRCTAPERVCKVALHIVPGHWARGGESDNAEQKLGTGRRRALRSRAARRSVRRRRRAARRRHHDETTEDGGGEGGGELAGAKGTTPAPGDHGRGHGVPGPDGRAREDAGIDLDGTYALRARGLRLHDASSPWPRRSPATTARAHAAEIVNVTKGGEKCSTYADCLALIEAGTDIDYEGVSGATDMSGNGEPLIGSYAVQVYGDDNRLDAEPRDVPQRRGQPRSSRTCRTTR